jgi:hypothetical protein
MDEISTCDDVRPGALGNFLSPPAELLHCTQIRPDSILRSTPNPRASGHDAILRAQRNINDILQTTKWTGEPPSESERHVSVSMAEDGARKMAAAM